MTSSPQKSPSATEPDWSREHVARCEWSPAKRLLRSIRRYQYWSRRSGPMAALMRKVYVIRHRRWSAMSAADVPLNATLGGGLRLPHPAGIVIHPGAVIGPNCLIFGGVAIGDGGAVPGVPTLGGNVNVGAGAKILGGVHIGDGAKVGANAVVLCDVPAGATAVGVPARIIPATGGAS